MGYFDGLIDGSMKEDEHGRTVFYPFGVLGKGKVIPSDEEKQDLRNFIKRFYQFLFPLMILGGCTVGWLWTAVASSAVLVPYYYVLHKKIRNFSTASSRLTFAESLRNSALSYGGLTLWVLFLASLAFVLAAIFVAVSSHDSDMFILIGALIFTFCSLVFGMMIRLKNK